MQRLVAARPEPLTSRFRVTADLVAERALATRRPGRAEAPAAHEPRPRAAAPPAPAAGDRRVPQPRGGRRRRASARRATAAALGVRVGSLVEGEDERSALRFSAPLMTFAIEVIATLDRDDPAYVVDVVSVVESVLDDPRQILFAQQNAARAAEVARLKAEGVPYEERMERLESITWPRPLAELLDALFTTYRSHHPWIADGPVAEVDPARDARGRRHASPRSCGATGSSAARAWCCATSPTRGARSTARCPTTSTRRRLEDVVEWLGELIRATDATLLDEWTLPRRPPRPRPPRARRPRRRSAVAAAGVAHGGAHRRVRLGRAAGQPVATRRWPTAAAGARSDLAEAMAPYWAEYDAHRHRRRRASRRPSSTLVEEPDRWVVTQRLVDPAGDGEWRFVASVDLVASRSEGAPTLQLDNLGRF